MFTSIVLVFVAFTMSHPGKLEAVIMSEKKYSTQDECMEAWDHGQRAEMIKALNESLKRPYMLRQMCRVIGQDA